MGLVFARGDSFKQHLFVVRHFPEIINHLPLFSHRSRNGRYTIRVRAVCIYFFFSVNVSGRFRLAKTKVYDIAQIDAQTPKSIKKTTGNI
jgi:hypothetical protein